MRLLSLFFGNNSNHKLLLLLLFIASIINAVIGLSIGSPAAGTKIQGGAQFLVSWSTGPAENITSVNIELAQGLENAVKTVAILASSVPAAGGSRSVSMPASISSANNYYIRVIGNNSPATVASQGPITYIGTTAPPDNNSSSIVRPTSTSSFSLILPGTSSASSLPRSSATSNTVAQSSNLITSTSSSIAKETSNSSSDDTGKSKDGGNNDGGGLSGGAIAGIAIGAVAGAGAIVAIMMCVRRSGRDRDDAVETASEIFASPPGYHAESKNATSTPAPVHQRQQEYTSTSPRLQQETQQGRFYSTGYETEGYYNNTAPVSDPYYQQQGGYDQYNNYGYHPAAVYMPNLAHGHDQVPYQGYEGYGNEQQQPQQYWDPQQQQQTYPPQPVYYNSSPPIQTQQRHEPPHSPTH